MMHPAVLILCDKVDYALAWAAQQQLVRDRALDGRADTLILLEHNPVYTVGRSGKTTHFTDGETTLRDRSFPTYHVERGGSVTYHGPGQIIGYPILRLRSFCAGPKTYMRMLEELVIRVLMDWGVEASRMDKLTGVWVGKDPIRKIAAMGVRITNGVTMHGFSLNVNVDLEPYRAIVPCGLQGCEVTSMAEVLGRSVSLREVRDALAVNFRDLFGVYWVSRHEGTLTSVIPDRRLEGVRLSPGQEERQENVISTSA